MGRSDKDIGREEKARLINSRLIGTGMSVAAGGRKGPYTLVVSRLSRKRVEAIVELILGSKLLD